MQHRAAATDGRFHLVPPRREPLHELRLRQQVFEVVVPTEAQAARDKAGRVPHAEHDPEAEPLLEMASKKDRQRVLY